VYFARSNWIDIPRRQLTYSHSRTPFSTSERSTEEGADSCHLSADEVGLLKVMVVEAGNARGAPDLRKALRARDGGAKGAEADEVVLASSPSYPSHSPTHPPASSNPCLDTPTIAYHIHRTALPSG
jgi:hypothetical protein